MPGTEVRPHSHVDTPEWQTFEARMLARRAERRAQAARVRRARLAKLAGVVTLLIVAGAIGFAVTWLARQPIALTASAPVAPPGIALRINDGAPPLPLIDAESVPILPTPVPAPIEAIVDDGTAPPPSAPATNETPTERAANQPPAPATTAPHTAKDVFVSGVNERALPMARTANPPTVIEPPAGRTASRTAAIEPPAGRAASRTSAIEPPTTRTTTQPAAIEPSTTRTTTQPAAVEPPASSVAMMPGTRENTAPAEPTPVGTAGSARVVPGVPVRPDTSPPSAAPASSTANAGNVARPVPDARAAVRNVLERYRTAYERLDAAAAGEVWPGVDRRALARAFDSLHSQQIEFHDCRILTAATTAHATCTGRARAIPKIGSGGASEADRTWEFSLVQKGNEWQIAKATVR